MPCTSRYFGYLIAFVSLIGLSSCETLSSLKFPTDTEAHEWDNLEYTRQNIIKTARSTIGAPYKYAAQGPNQFDCSGLVKYVFGKNAISVKGSASHISNEGRDIGMSNAQPGDLIFYKRNNDVFHVSIISDTSDGFWVIHSTSSRGVMEQDLMLSSYWKPMVYKVISLKAFTN